MPSIDIIPQNTNDTVLQFDPERICPAMFYCGIPTGIETLERHGRWANWLLMAAMGAAFLLTGLGSEMSSGPVRPWMLDGWSLKGIFGSLFLHADFFHLVGNLVFLCLFGNVVCQTVGWWKYLLLVFGAQFFAGSLHILSGGGPAVGASGAISGLCGVTLALFPFNRLEYGAGSVESTFQWELKVWHFCLLHFAWDVYAAVAGRSAIAYWAHMGGFAGGVLLGLGCLHAGWIQLSRFDNLSLYEKLTGRELARLDDEMETEPDNSAS